MVFESQRLLFRKWKISDREPFHEMNADPDVMEFFPSVLSREESDNYLDAIISRIERDGFGFWAVERKLSKEFIGFIGINPSNVGLDIEPCIEIGWRLKKDFWGRGYATEGAIRVLRFAFDEHKFDKVYSFTTLSNRNSENVMKKIGMKNTNKNFYHPKLPKEHLLCEHVLYIITRDDFSYNLKEERL